jgi:cobalamin biosynthesis protein CobD/CbiB
MKFIIGAFLVFTILLFVNFLLVNYFLLFLQGFMIVVLFLFIVDRVGSLEDENQTIKNQLKNRSKELKRLQIEVDKILIRNRKS